MMKRQILYMLKNIYVLCGVIITLFINKDILREAKLTAWNIFMQTHRFSFLMLLIHFVVFGKSILPQHMLWSEKILNVEWSNVLVLPSSIVCFPQKQTKTHQYEDLQVGRCIILFVGSHWVEKFF